MKKAISGRGAKDQKRNSICAKTIGTIILIAWTVVGGGFAAQTPPIGSRLSPDQWPREERERYLALEDDIGKPAAAAVGSKGMVAGTSNPFAIHAGLEALKQGGSAADAVLTSALTQIALTAGSAISYAGVMTVVYYDAASGKVHTLNACFNTVQNEMDPRTIPPMGSHSGRSALVPGFMAGVQALHDRFGKLPFASLFVPAIWVAENGFTVGSMVGRWIGSQKDYLTRLPETKRIFTKENGDPYKVGDLFRQPELAETLKKVAGQGAAYIYKGDWARHLVSLVQREGGKMTLDDLAAYKPLWTEPLQETFRGYRVVSLGAPNAGGLWTLANLKLFEAADVKKHGHYTRSPEALYYLIQIDRLNSAFFRQPPELLKSYFPDIDPSPEARLKPETIHRFWSQIQRPDWRETAKGLISGTPRTDHSAGVIAVDERGNVASLLHSINCVAWGATGIFVDGISIGDSASFQQNLIARVGRGVRLPESTNPLIVLKDGKPILASTSIGSALQEATFQNLINILDFGMNPKTSVDQPNTMGPFFGFSSMSAPLRPELEKEAVREGDFSEEVLSGVRALGQEIKVVPMDRASQQGFWIGIAIDPKTRKLLGGVYTMFNAFVEGY
ncbi:MAG: gamma-glutamyltransferase [Candidatus Aminicenantes bacterium]|nr:gamma-glutamyltransferase [Candidatus Aminicenantes bacterium]